MRGKTPEPASRFNPNPSLSDGANGKAVQALSAVNSEKLQLVLEIRGKDIRANRMPYRLSRPKASFLDLVRMERKRAFMDQAVGLDMLRFNRGAPNIGVQELETLRRDIPDTKLLFDFSDCCRQIVFARTEVPTHRSVPFPRLDVFASRPFLEIDVPCLVEDEDVDRAVSEGRVTVTTGTGGSADHAAMLVDNLEYLVGHRD